VLATSRTAFQHGVRSLQMPQSGRWHREGEAEAALLALLTGQESYACAPERATGVAGIVANLPCPAPAA
jgi:hypothetical protein